MLNDLRGVFGKTQKFQFVLIKYFLALILMVIVALTSVFYFGSTKMVYDLADRLTAKVSQGIIQETDRFLDKPATYSKVAANFLSDIIVDEASAVENRELIWRYMWQFMAATPAMQSFFLADPQGSYIQVRRTPRLATRYIDRSNTGEEPSEHWLYRDENYALVGEKTKVPTFDPRTRPWYEMTKTVKQNYWTDAYVFTTAQTSGISVTYPIVNAAGELVGVVCVNTPLSSISKFISQQEVSENGYAFIVDEDEKVIAYPDLQKLTVKDKNTGKLRLTALSDLGSEAAIEAYRIHIKTGDRINHFKVAGEEFISSVVPFSSTGRNWKVVVVIPKEDLLATVYETIFDSLVAGAIIAMLALIAIVYLSRRISAQITQVSRQAKYISEFALDEVRGVSSDVQEIYDMNKSIMSSVEALKVFRKFVPEQIVKKLIQSDEPARAGGSVAELTIMVTDIDDFSAISRRMLPNDLLMHLSDYFDRVTRLISMERGTLDKYVGPSILAFWGRPDPLENAPHHACEAALKAVKMLARANPKWDQEGKPQMHARFGIHTGPVSVGNIGSEERLSYSIIGDNMTFTSRLQRLNAFFGTDIIISATTYEMVAEQFHCRFLGTAIPDHNMAGVEVYELVAQRDRPISNVEVNILIEHGRAVRILEAGDPTKALQLAERLLASVPDDRPLHHLVERCRLAVGPRSMAYTKLH
ncbi:MAG: hypothetical protein JKY27_13085 [Magnetovibrio sp.]|nr:hypothetical protein [Magnetovibrio sp.]